MANIKSSKQHNIKSQRKRCYNTSRKSMLRTFMKKVFLAITLKKKNIAMKEFYHVQSILDRLAMKKIIHKNTVSQYKLRFIFNN
ncbi:30S ribosomal protein S20 [Buchnera aphidicola]|uniref:Small ribosomal subunit protein bS20 n=1 Tax=Buchnera aphidicola (Stegophylla sp.) TaxID=2315800 RepID=A0A4D6YA52_9GAMM|nr:30S ribosomal protein S20 [Buchnera aphidicola (Stegophylla sp.)]